MRLILGSSARTAFAVALLATVAFASTAFAQGPRVPQVAFQNAALQGYFNGGVDPGVNTAGAQLDGQNFAVNIGSGVTDFTLTLKAGGASGLNTIGCYNAGAAAPTLFQLFPSTATSGYYVTCKFQVGGTLKVTLFDAGDNSLGQTTYAGVTRDQIGFYISGPNGTYYSQDYRNAGGKAQVLTYQGTGSNGSDWWECFQDTPYAAATSTFDAAVLQLQSVVPIPVPTKSTSWGQLKADYR
jgi:hypothetical protein